jgi:hypothetical protein
VIAKLLGVPGGEEHLVHIYELGGRETAVGAVALWTIIRYKVSVNRGD